jgi:hypothetical protein
LVFVEETMRFGMNHAVSRVMDPDDSVVLIALIRLQCAAESKGVPEIDQVALRDALERMTGTRFATARRVTYVLPAATWTNASDVGAPGGARMPANSQLHLGPNAMPDGSCAAMSYIHPSVIVAIADRLKELQPPPFLEARELRASLEIIGDSWAFRTKRA